MTEAERVEWIKTLKEGDEVCYNIGGSFGSRPTIKVVTVKKITSKKGMVRTSDDRLFNARGRSDYGTRWVYLDPYDTDMRSKVAREKLVCKAESSMFILGSSNRTNLVKVPSGLLQMLIDLEELISQSLKKEGE